MDTMSINNSFVEQDPMVFTMFAGFMIYIVVLVILLALAFQSFNLLLRYHVFKKIGCNPNLAFIPFYSDVVLYNKMIGNRYSIPKLGVILAIVHIIVTLGIVFGSYLQNNIIVLVASLISIAISAFVNHNISKSFGKNIAFTVGLTLMNLYFMPVIAFGNLPFNGDEDKESREDEVRFSEEDTQQDSFTERGGYIAGDNNNNLHSSNYSGDEEINIPVPSVSSGFVSQDSPTQENTFGYEGTNNSIEDPLNFDDVYDGTLYGGVMESTSYGNEVYDDQPTQVQQPKKLNIKLNKRA